MEQKIERRVIGPIVATAADVSSRSIEPEKTRLEAINMQVVVDAAGAITTRVPDPLTQTVLPGHHFHFASMVGFMSEPDIATGAPSLVRVQVEEDGRGMAVFRSAVNLAALVGPGGPAHRLEWPVGYKFRIGASISVTFTIDAARWATEVGQEKILGVVLMGTLTNECAEAELRSGGLGAAEAR